MTKLINEDTKNKVQDTAQEKPPEKDTKNRVKLDEILKSLFGVSKKVLIKMMNSLFNENFDINMTDVTFENNEFVSDEYDIIRGDLFLKIVNNEKPNHYHIELQTKNDATMVIRMFEYGFQKGKEIAKHRSSEETVIYIPKQLVIFIEQNANIQDELKMRLIFPEGQEIKYSVPVMKYWQYDSKTIIDKGMYPLLPLQIFKLRYKMESITRRDKNDKLNLNKAILEAKEEAENISLESKKLYDQGEINGDDLHKVLLAVGSLFEYLNDKYGEDEKLVEEVLQVTRILYDPVRVEEAKKEERREVARNLLLFGDKIEKIMQVTKLTREEIEKIKKDNPQKTSSQENLQSNL